LHLLISRHYLVLAADFSLKQYFTIGFGGGIVKLTDFGLWFKFWNEAARTTTRSTTIPQKGFFYILYDGVELGHQYSDFDLMIMPDQQFIIKLKNNFKLHGDSHRIGRQLTLDDFEVIPNPNYGGDL
jgi:hypothetical protein